MFQPDLFDLDGPTPAATAQLAALAAGKSAPQLVALAEQLAEAYAATLPKLQYTESAEWLAFRQQQRKDCGFDRSYSPDNSTSVWWSLIWLSLSAEQWASLAEHWQGGVLNPHAMSGPFGFSMPDNDSPIVMVCPKRGHYELTTLRPAPGVDLQIGGGTLGPAQRDTFEAMVQTKVKNVQSYGGPPYRRPTLVLLHGMPYYMDDCQWSECELREAGIGRSDRELSTRIWLQFLSRQHTGHYVPLL